MMIFEANKLTEAIKHSENGGQSLHLHQFITPNAPNCFKQAIKRGEFIAHLFDQDEDRLIATAHQAGVNKIFVHKRGKREQHIDLCGKPLKNIISSRDF